MTRIRVAFFLTTFLGFMYGVLALMSETKTDATTGMLVALAGIVGWTVCGWMEQR